VWIFMTVPAKLMSARTFEVTVFMAFVTTQLSVFSGQVELREVVVKNLSGSIIPPAASVVTCLAPAVELQIFKGAAMRACVTAAAAVERQTFEEELFCRRTSRRGCNRFLSRTGEGCLGARMAFLARSLLMKAGERKGCAGMAEF
jgi:hypothetical protein